MLVADGIEFAALHFDDLDNHPLLVHRSALAFMSPKSLLHHTFHNPIVHPTVIGPVRKIWSSLHNPLYDDPGGVSFFAFSPDGSRVVSGSEGYAWEIRVWNAVSGDEAAPPLMGHPAPMPPIAFSADGTRIAAASLNGTVRIWEAECGGNSIMMMRWPKPLSQSTRDDPGETLSTVSADRSPIETKPGLGPGQNSRGQIHAIAFSPNGDRIACAASDTIRVWDLQSGVEVISVLRGHTDTISAIIFSPDGTRIVSGSYDMTVRVWDVSSGTEVLPPLRGHKNNVNSVAYSADGSWILSTDSIPQTLVWDALSGSLNLDSVQAMSMSSGIDIDMRLNKDNWIVDQKTNRYLTKLPHSIVVQTHSVHGRSLAIGTISGGVFIIHFPAGY